MPLRSRPLSFVSPRAEHLGHAGIGGQAVHHGLGVGGDGQEVEVAHGFAAAAIAAGRFDLARRPGSFAHMGEDLLDELVGLGPEHALVGLGGEGDAGQDRLLRSWRQSP